MISDDQLLLYYYRELDAEERARVAAAVSSDPQLAQRLHSLVARLDAAAATPEVPVPAAVQERWRAALDRAATQARSAAVPPRRFSATTFWQAAAAAVTVFALLFSVQRFMEPTPDLTVRHTTGEPAANAAAEEPSAYDNGLKVHLASTERRLAAIGEAPPEERARMIETIIAQNKVYALAAERAGEPKLARVLRAFNPILEELANDGGAESAGDVARLSFEMRVMQARLGAGAASSNIL